MIHNQIHNQDPCYFGVDIGASCLFSNPSPMYHTRLPSRTPEPQVTAPPAPPEPAAEAAEAPPSTSKPWAMHPQQGSCFVLTYTHIK